MTLPIAVLSLIMISTELMQMVVTNNNQLGINIPNRWVIKIIWTRRISYQMPIAFGRLPNRYLLIENPTVKPLSNVCC